MKPKRIQRKRTKGWRMPPNAVYVGRPTKWGNPYRAGDPGIPDSWTAKCCYRNHAATLDVSELRGKDLACWCSLDKPCHADVLLEIANQGE